nr:hypothetical protein [Betaproteobacteria bacterium]
MWKTFPAGTHRLSVGTKAQTVTKEARNSVQAVRPINEGGSGKDKEKLAWVTSCLQTAAFRSE